MPHYSKSQIFVQKTNFDKTPTFSRVFHLNFFWQFLSWNQSCQQLRSPKPQHFHEFFSQKNRQFSQEFKVEFLDKKWRFRTVFVYWGQTFKIRLKHLPYLFFCLSRSSPLSSFSILRTMATHNVKVTYSGPAQSQSNPDEVSVSIIGQVPNLKLVKFEELQSKFGSCVTSKVILSERSELLTFLFVFWI